jgi:hypothetical protein
MNAGSFPDLALTDLAYKGGAAGQDGRPPSTAPLEAAAEKLAEVRDYLFNEAEEPTSPENMTALRRFLEHVYSYLATVTAFYEADGESGTSGQGGGEAEVPGARPAAKQGIREASQAARDTIVTARKCARVMKRIGEDWEGRQRTDPGRPLDEKRGDFRALLDSQQEVEDSISVLSDRLRKFVQVIVEIGEGGAGSATPGRPQHNPARDRAMEGRPYYMSWRPRIVEQAS